MGKASEIAIAFATGIAVGSLIWLVAAIMSGCVSRVKPFPADQLAVHDIEVRIDALQRQRLALLKDIEKRKEEERAEKSR